MTRSPKPLTAICAALPLPDAAEVPEWVQLLPAVNGTISTHDGRGPYRVEDAAAIIAASFRDPRDAGGLIIDENHAQDLAAPKGGPSPARGRITEMQVRNSGIWGKVTWSDTGRALLADRAYRGISPVILHHPETHEIVAVLRASLVNYPNLSGMTALNAEGAPPMMGKIAKALGLAEDATEDAIIAKITGMMGEKKPDAAMQAMQAAMASIGTTLGVDGAKPDAVKAAVEALQASKIETATLTATVAALQAEQKRTKAEAWMAALLAQRVGIPTDKREALIALHMSDAVQADVVAKLYPTLAATHASGTPPGEGKPATALNAEQAQAAKLLGLDPAQYLKTLNAELGQKETV
jgi:phage I-like protein